MTQGIRSNAAVSCGGSFCVINYRFYFVFVFKIVFFVSVLANKIKIFFIFIIFQLTKISLVESHAQAP